MFRPVHLSDVIENADDPARVIVSRPDPVGVEFESLNSFDTAAPPRVARRTADGILGPSDDCDHLSQALFAWPTSRVRVQA